MEYYMPLLLELQRRKFNEFMEKFVKDLCYLCKDDSEDIRDLFEERGVGKRISDVYSSINAWLGDSIISSYIDRIGFGDMKDAILEDLNHNYLDKSYPHEAWQNANDITTFLQAAGACYSQVIDDEVRYINRWVMYNVLFNDIPETSQDNKDTPPTHS